MAIGRAEWLPELGDDDLDVLLEALEAWEVKDLSGELMAELFDEVLVDRNPIRRAHVEAQREKQKIERIHVQRLRKERSVLLRAKIITIRDRRRSESMTREALQQ